MNIPPVGAPVTMKTEERPAAVDPQRTVSAVANNTKADAATGAQPSRKELGEAVKQINESMLGSAQSLEFSIDEDSKDIVVKVIDQNTKEVLRQMPSKEALEIAKSLDKMRGLLINQTA